MPDPHEGKPHYGAAKETLDRTVDWSQKGCGGGMVVGLVLALVVSAIAFPPLLLALIPVGAIIAYLLLRKPRQENTVVQTTSVQDDEPAATLDFGTRDSLRLYSNRLARVRGLINVSPVAEIPLGGVEMFIEPKPAGNASFVIKKGDEVFASHDAVRLKKAERFLSQLHAAQSGAEAADRA